jgi:HPt (histidine-containing phosphotransfer) domain-containing protein
MLDITVALERVGGDEELLKEVAQLFLEDYPQSVEAIEQALAKGDARGVERAAHTLKGAAANFGVPPVVDAACAMEQSGRRGDLSGAPASFAALKQHLVILHTELERLAAGAS